MVILLEIEKSLNANDAGMGTFYLMNHLNEASYPLFFLFYEYCHVQCARM